MRIGIISDVHDNWVNLEKAVNIFNEEDFKYILMAGDLISPSGIEILAKFNGNVYLVFGNNEGEKLGFFNKINKYDNLTLFPDIYEGEIEEIKVFMNHYPRITELAAKSNEFELCIFGHNHEAEIKKINNTICINPGTLGSVKDATYAVFDTETRLGEIKSLK